MATRTNTPASTPANAPERAVTQRKIAEFLGISYLTVNKSLSESAGVSPETRQRVREAAKKLGYQKNQIAVSLRAKRTFAIGLVGCNSPHSYWSELMESIEACGRAAGYHVILSHRSADGGSAEEVAFLIERQVDGLFIVPNDRFEDRRELARLIQSTPTVFIDSQVPGVPTSFVGTDGWNGMREMARYLIGLGHRSFAFVASPEGDINSDQRLAGFQDEAARAAELGVGEVHVIRAASALQEAGYAVAEQALATGATAIVAANDPLAIGVLLRLRDLNVSVPDEVSVAGYAGMSEGALVSPSLTSVVQPVTRLGQVAFAALQAAMEDATVAPNAELLKDELIIRKSTGAPKRRGE